MSRTEATTIERTARQAFKDALQPLLAADGRKFDVYEWQIFYDALRDVPLALLKAAVVDMARRPRRFPFKPTDVREAAERSRQNVLKLNPWRPCRECRDLNGFVEITDGKGVKRLRKCGCIATYNENLLKTGVPIQPLLQLTDGAEVEA